eukprot:EG_transcript_30109
MNPLLTAVVTPPGKQGAFHSPTAPQTSQGPGHPVPASAPAPSTLPPAAHPTPAEAAHVHHDDGRRNVCAACARGSGFSARPVTVQRCTSGEAVLGDAYCQHVWVDFDGSAGPRHCAVCHRPFVGRHEAKCSECGAEAHQLCSPMCRGPAAILSGNSH